MKQILIIIVIALSTSLFASDTIYYSNSWKVTNIEQAVFYRVASFNNDQLFFEGPFSDYLILNNQILEKGIYTEKKKNGEFIQYFQDGNLKSKGSYNNNKLEGLWYYYYPSGHLKMAVDFSSNLFSIKEFYNIKDDTLIINGNGKCTFELTIFGTPTTLSCIFKNGARDKKWNYIKPDGKVVLTEKYKKGKLASSMFKGSLKKENAIGSMCNISYFTDYKHIITENVICEFHYDENRVSGLNFITKELNLTDYVSLTSLNSNLPNDAIISIAKDSNNTYYFGSENNGIIKFDTAFTYLNNKNTPIKGNLISNIEVDNNNKVWFSYGSSLNDSDVKSAGLGCLTDQEILIFNTKNSGLTSNNIKNIFIDSNNVKWFSTANCIISYDDKIWKKHFNRSQALSTIDTVKYHNASDYRKYANKIGSETSISTYDYHNPYIHYETPSTLEKGTSFYIRTSYESVSHFVDIKTIQHQQLYINSENSGCYTYTNPNWTLISDTSQIECLSYQLKANSIKISTAKFILDFLKNNTYLKSTTYPITNLIVDKQGSVWIIIHGVLLKFTDRKITEYVLNIERKTYFYKNVLKRYNCLFEDTDGSIWVGIKNGIIKVE